MRANLATHSKAGPKNDLRDRDRLAKAVYEKLGVKDPYRVQIY